MGFLAAMNFIIFADTVFGDDKSEPEYKNPRILIYLIWALLPMSFLMLMTGMWLVLPGDLLNIGQTIYSLTGYDAITAKESVTIVGDIFAIITTGFIVGTISGPAAHELVHRSEDKISMLIGRWMLAFTCDSNFMIEHVYGHHVYVSTPKDPATAPRGRSIHKHIFLAIIGANKWGWILERDRLKKIGKPVFSHHNRAIRGYLMSIVLMLAIYAMAGIAGVGFFLLVAFIGKSILEMVNFIEHYGLVRDPEDRVDPKHSWNSNKKFGSWMTFNLNRHSHHHEDGSVPYYKLKSYDEAPMMYHGYITCMTIALLLPPVWNKIMAKKLIEWDEKYASEKERKLAHEANLNSGIKELIDYAKGNEDKLKKETEYA